jgi:mRNA interferase YafQ
MLTIKYQTAFKKDYKRVVRRGYDVRLLEKVIELLAEQKPLPKEYHDHNLTGNYAGCRECHITPDWLLIYEVKETELLLYLTRTGTHSDLF